MIYWDGCAMEEHAVKVINLLTICRKAGKLTFGFDASKEAILSEKARLIILASDISQKTEKEIRFFAAKTNITVLRTDINIGELSAGTGKKAGVIAVCDEGFAQGFNKLHQLHC